MTILFHFIGDTSKHQTNVISLAYNLDKAAGNIQFTVAYSRKDDIYDKHKAKDLLFKRFEAGHYYEIDYQKDFNVIDQLVMGLRFAQKDEWFRINTRFIKHPVWAYKLYTKDMKWHLAKNSKKVTKFIEELK